MPACEQSQPPNNPDNTGCRPRMHAGLAVCNCRTFGELPRLHHESSNSYHAVKFRAGRRHVDACRPTFGNSARAPSLSPCVPCKRDPILALSLSESSCHFYALSNVRLPVVARNPRRVLPLSVRILHSSKKRPDPPISLEFGPDGDNTEDLRHEVTGTCQRRTMDRHGRQSLRAHALLTILTRFLGEE